jgi:hypothetical protein
MKEVEREWYVVPVIRLPQQHAVTSMNPFIFVLQTRASLFNETYLRQQNTLECDAPVKK